MNRGMSDPFDMTLALRQTIVDISTRLDERKYLAPQRVLELEKGRRSAWFLLGMYECEQHPDEGVP